MTTSTPWEFHYQRDRVATFMARTPGEYTVELQTGLVFEDTMFPGLKSDTQTMKVVVEGEAGAGGVERGDGEMRAQETQCSEDEILAINRNSISNNMQFVGR